MELFISIIMLIVGIVFVIKGADFLVDGSSILAKKVGVSELVIGLTIVSMGTSAPELVVNLVAGMQGKHDVVVGNIFGSCVCNILLILGISALIAPIAVGKSTVWKEIPMSFGAIVLTGVIALFFGDSGSMIINRWESSILLIFFVLFLIYVTFVSKSNSIEKIDSSEHNVFYVLGLIALGFVGLFLGGRFTVDNAVKIAEVLGVSERLIALTIVSIGTSLPELATSAVAAFKKQSDIAVGNVVGSNIFNLLFILGVGGAFFPIHYSQAFNFDLIVMGASTIMLFLFMFVGKRNKLDRWEGSLFLTAFVAYIVYQIMRG